MVETVCWKPGVSEKDSTRKLADQARSHTPLYRRVCGCMDTGFRQEPFSAARRIKGWTA